MNLAFLLLLSSIGCISACNFSITIKQELVFDGFHRNLTYDITVELLPDIQKMWPYKDCYVSLYQPLPVGVYANADELDDLSRCNKVYAQAQKTNVELPAHLSDPSVALIFNKVEGPSIQVWLPLHARYHKAVRFGGFMMNRIEPPQLYMRCPNNTLEACERQLETAKFVCENESNKHCLWKKIPFIIVTDIPVQWRTPVGDTNHYLPVVVVTNMVITLGSIYLMVTLSSSKFKMYDYERIV